MNRLINGLKKLQKTLDGRARTKLLEQLKEFGVEYAKAHVVNIDTGATIESIHGEVEGSTLTITAGANAIWLEFGTGITYNQGGYPGELPEGVSEIGTFGMGHGSDPGGWVYPTDNPEQHGVLRDKNGQPRQTEDGMYLAHTYGIPSNHFMWDTATAIEEKAQELGLKLIESELRVI